MSSSTHSPQNMTKLYTYFNFDFPWLFQHHCKCSPGRGTDWLMNSVVVCHCATVAAAGELSYDPQLTNQLWHVIPLMRPSSIWLDGVQHTSRQSTAEGERICLCSDMPPAAMTHRASEHVHFLAVRLTHWRHPHQNSARLGVHLPDTAAYLSLLITHKALQLG